MIGRIELSAFSYSSLESILIPRSVEILSSSCFSSCQSLSSISFESNERLTRIESSAFSDSSLQSILIRRNVRFIDGSAFSWVGLSSIRFESGNTTFVVENDLLIDSVCHKLIRHFSKSSQVIIPNDIGIRCSSCFSSCESLSSLSFESNSRLMRVESSAVPLS
jgi:hypothetical protein